MHKIKYLECHADVHDWDEMELTRTGGRKVMGYERTARCTHCHGVRTVTYTAYGIVINRWYNMPSDYRGPVGMTKADYRKVWFDEKLKRSKLKVVSDVS